jgi:hypothetical protein
MAESRGRGGRTRAATQGGRSASGRAEPTGSGRRRSSADTGAQAELNETPPAIPPVCSVAFCPICTMVTAVGEVQPELMEHLLVAGREVLLAVRAVIDARLEGSAPAPKLERLTIE